MTLLLTFLAHVLLKIEGYNMFYLSLHAVNGFIVYSTHDLDYDSFKPHTCIFYLCDAISLR